MSESTVCREVEENGVGVGVGVGVGLVFERTVGS